MDVYRSSDPEVLDAYEAWRHAVAERRAALHEIVASSFVSGRLVTFGAVGFAGVADDGESPDGWQRLVDQGRLVPDPKTTEGQRILREVAALSCVRVGDAPSLPGVPAFILVDGRYVPVPAQRPSADHSRVYVTWPDLSDHRPPAAKDGRWERIDDDEAARVLAA